MSRPSASAAPAIVWFRDDLRLSDHPALHAAVATGQPILTVYIHDEASPGIRPLGGASRWWLHHSLKSLSERMRQRGGRLHLFAGEAGPILHEIAEASGASACFWNRRYGRPERSVDDALEASLTEAGLRVVTCSGTLLHEPGEVQPKAGGSFKVFTPFLKASMALGSPGHPVAAPAKIAAARATFRSEVDLDDLRLLPTKPDWAAGLRATWTPGEPEAQKLLHDFVAGGLRGYAEDRNRPSIAATSRLSPHLRFGEISPRQVVVRARHAGADGSADEQQVEKFISEVVWRDFAYNLLVHHPEIATEPVQADFRAFPYRTVRKPLLDAWRFGHTGYPIVDAGMRQLWQTGVMHNRVRMITASFLVKHLLADWRIGEAWFWDTLCDADPASNPVNWQWVAGSGADPAPYFRIFNPTLQGEKFDPDGAYVRTFVPELADMPARWIHTPWTAPPEVLDQAHVVLGKDYPRPVVEHDKARAEALAALAAMRREASPRTAAARA